MEVKANQQLFRNLIDKAKKSLIIISEGADADVVSAALALSSIIKSKDGIVHLYSPKKLEGDIALISGADQIKSTFESKNLILSFDYTKHPIEKISYKMNKNTFDLIVKPRLGNISLDEIQTSFSGGDYSLIIFIGVESVDNLPIFKRNREFFESLPSINIDIKEENKRFGKLNIIDEKKESICVLLALIFSDSEIKITKKASDLLLHGIKEATQNFAKVGSSSVFEAAAILSKTKEEAEGSLEEGKKVESENYNLPKDWLSPKIFRSSKVS